MSLPIIALVISVVYFMICALIPIACYAARG